MQGKYLITTDNWFYGPDGGQYKAVWGEVKPFSDEDTFGIKTNMRATNWYVQVGTEDNHIIIAGCQIHYAIKMLQEPDTDLMVNDYTIEAGKRILYSRPTTILKFKDDGTN